MTLPFAGSPGAGVPFTGSGMPLKGVGREHLRNDAVGPDQVADDTVGPDQLQDGAVSLVHLAAALQAFLVPTGALIMWGNAAAPTGWFLCDGAAVSRTTEAALFAVYGTTYGVGDGSTTFNLPDLRQRFPLGKAAAGTGATLGGTGGTIDHVHNLDTATSHARITLLTSAPHARQQRKTVTSWNETLNVTATSGAAGATASTLGTTLGGDSGTANPPFQVVNFICKR